MTSNFKIPLTSHLTSEEKSFVVYNAYYRRVLKSKEISNFLFKDRLNTWTLWGFPVATFFVSS